MTTASTLQVTTPTDREIVIKRVFDAPRNLVSECFCRPELLKRWLLGPPGWEMIGCEVANKVGERYRFVWRNAEGQQLGISGVCREADPPARWVFMEKMDGYPGEYQVTNALVEQGGKTTLTLSLLYESKMVRDAALKSGMERGVGASYDQLAALLASGEVQASTSAGA